MKKYVLVTINNVRSFIENDMESSSDEKIAKILAELEKKIAFYQHERLIHLIVTFFFALFLLLEIFFAAMLPCEYALFSALLVVIFFCMTVAYVFHYYFLENSVQELYKLRDELVRRLEPDVKI